MSENSTSDEISKVYDAERADDALAKAIQERLLSLSMYLHMLGSSMGYLLNSPHAEILMKHADSIQDDVETLRKIGYRDTSRKLQLQQISSGAMLSGMLAVASLKGDENKNKDKEPSKEN